MKPLKQSTVKKLDPREHVLLRPEVYLGPTSPEEDSRRGFRDGQVVMIKGAVPAAIRMLQEVMDNAVDSGIRSNFKAGKHIKVEFNEDGFTVTDDGPGIPIKKDPDHKIYQPELALAHSLAGSNFEGDERQTSGLFGLGVFAVNVMCIELSIVTKGKGKKYEQSFHNNLLEIKKPKITKVGPRNHGTTVRAVIDQSRVDWTEKEISVGVQLLNNIMFCYPEIDMECVVHGKKIDLLEGDNFVEACGIDAICDVNQNHSRVVIGAQATAFTSWVNGTECQGIHIAQFKAMLSKAMVETLNMNGLERGDISRAVGGLIAVRVNNPAFHSPTKLTMVDCDKTSLRAALEPLVKTVVGDLSKNEVFLQTIDTILESRAKKKLRAAENKVSRKKPKKLIDATSPRASDRWLFITEGDSAKGRFTQARDPRTHAIYCLRGKTRNAIQDDDPTKLINSPMLIELSAVLGLSLTSPDITKCRYSKILITTDADHDGNSICGLLYGFFWRFWPELMEKGRVYRLLTPRFVVGKKRKFIYTEKDLRAADRRSGVEYIKGLGGLTLGDVKKVMNSPLMERAKVGDDTDDVMQLVFGKDANRRKEWLASD